MKKKHLIDLRNSLRRRGFWVDVVEGEIVLDRWFSERNYNEMLSLLMDLGISVEAGIRGIRVNSSVSDELLLHIETSTREDFKWKNIPRVELVLDSINDIPIFELDYGIASLVFAFNKAKLYTCMSCDGHGRKAPRIWFNGHTRLEEVQQILEMAALETSFAYDWGIKKEGWGFILFATRRLANGMFDVSKVQDDAISLSEFIVNKYSIK